MILLDTCALLWWTTDPAKLSERASKICQKIDVNGATVSSISLWELGIGIKKRKIIIGMTIESYLEKLKFLNLRIEPVTETVWLKNLALKWDNSDLFDRTIVATAILSDLPIVSADSEMRGFYKKVIW